jgi:hypothetical protein
MKIAKFVNYTNEEFIIHWNGKKKTFPPGKSKFMEDGVARVFAKHLANKILISLGKDNLTSPKKPEDVPQFMEIVNKCYFPIDDMDEDEEVEDEEANTKLANLNRRVVEENLLPPEARESGKKEKPAEIVQVPGLEEEEFEAAPTPRLQTTPALPNVDLNSDLKKD